MLHCSENVFKNRSFQLSRASGIKEKICPLRFYMYTNKISIKMCKMIKLNEINKTNKHSDEQM